VTKKINLFNTKINEEIYKQLELSMARTIKKIKHLAKVASTRLDPHSSIDP
jgi:hypothetical protein